MRESSKTLGILLLMGLLVFLSMRLWVSFPESPSTDVEEETISSISMNRLLAPDRVVVNFEGQEHTLFYELSPLWKDYAPWLQELFSHMEEGAKEITDQEYLALQDTRSLVFGYVRPWNSRMFLNLLSGPTATNVLPRGMQIQEIYIGAKADVLVITDGAGRHLRYGLSPGTLPQLAEQIEELYDSHRFRNYQNLGARHGFSRAIYVPSLTVPLPPSLHYNHAMSREEMNRLVTACLGVGPEERREVVEAGATTYVYGQKSVRIEEGGWVRYWDLEPEPAQEVNYFMALQSALEFLTTKARMEGDFALETVEKLDEGGKKGVLLGFQYKERNRWVYPMHALSDRYIEVEVFNKRVRRLRYLAKSLDTKDAEEGAFHEGYAPEEVLAKNLSRIEGAGRGPEALENLLKRIRAIDVVYVEDVAEEGESLIGAWAIRFEHKLYFFDMASGDYLMERSV